MKSTLISAFTSLSLVALAAGCGDSEEACDPTVTGTICTIMGSGVNGYDTGADDREIPALEARMNLPQDTLTSADGTTYVLDWNNHRIRRLTSDGMLAWVAGRGELGGTLDDPANNDFNHPTNMIFDPTGEKILIAAWHNSKIRELNVSTGEIIDTCGDGKRAYFGDDAPAVNSSLDLPASIALDPSNNLVIMDQANQVLRWVDSTGTIRRLAGQCIIDAPAPAGPGSCDTPVQCPTGPNGESGKWTCGAPGDGSCLLPCTPGYGGDGGSAAELRMSQPFGQSATPAGRIVFDSAGNLIFVDTSNNLIRMIDTDGNVHRIAGVAPVGGTTQSGYSGDGGPATEALLNYPVDIAIGDDGTLYFTDVNNHCVRSIDTSGIINTVAGICGQKGFSGDGGDPTKALLKLPFGVEWTAGKLLIADTGNNVIRSIVLP